MQADALNSLAPLTGSQAPLYKPGTIAPNLDPDFKNDLDAEKKLKLAYVQLIDQKQYEKLDAMAAEFRSGKARVTGGTWKLYYLYQDVSSPIGDDTASIEEWQTLLARTKEWATSEPNSITAQIAYAQSMIGVAWKARGHGYANEVAEDRWPLFEQAIEAARTQLEKAAKLDQKDPHWYTAMMIVAKAQGWDAKQRKDLLERAIEFEPDYYHTYRFYAEMLFPKWYGDPGDLEAFAQELHGRLNADQRDFVYFELASLNHCICGGHVQEQTMSWPQIKAGYEAMGRLYGSAVIKRNRMAAMSLVYEDFPYAEKVFNTLGDNWTPEVWQTKRSFDDTRGALLEILGRMQTLPDGTRVGQSMPSLKDPDPPKN